MPAQSFTPVTKDEITVRLHRVESSSETLDDFRWPSIDFEDHGWISREPIEEGLWGVPENLAIEFHGMFQLSAAQMTARYNREEADEWL